MLDLKNQSICPRAYVYGACLQVLPGIRPLEVRMVAAIPPRRGPVLLEDAWGNYRLARGLAQHGAATSRRAGNGGA